MNEYTKSREKIFQTNVNSPQTFKIIDVHVAEANSFIYYELKKKKLIKQVF